MNKYEITFTATLTKCDPEGFEIKTNMDTTIVGEYQKFMLDQLAMETMKQCGELLADHINEAKKQAFSLD